MRPTRALATLLLLPAGAALAQGQGITVTLPGSAPVTAQPATDFVAPAGMAAPAEGAFVPDRFEASLDAAHDAGASDHVLTVRKITAALENLSSGKVTVHSVTQVLDCRTGKLITQSRCDPCEYNLAEWPRRPLNRWYFEASWPMGATVARMRKQMEAEHFHNYFKLDRLDGTDHQGITYQFWHFDGRRPVPLKRKLPETVKAPPPPPEPVKPKFGPVQDVQIFHNAAKPDEVTTPPGVTTLSLKAVAYAAPEGSGVLSQVDDFTAMWSSSCGTLSSTSAKIVSFTLKPGIDRCKVFLFEGRTGKEDAVTVVRGTGPKPQVRVVITFEGGKDADGVVITGSARSVELQARAFDPEGNEISGFVPEWGVNGGQVEFLDAKKTRLRVHVEAGKSRCEVFARDPATNAEDKFIIEVR